MKIAVQLLAKFRRENLRLGTAGHVMHIDEQIIRRLESGLTTIAIEFRRLHMINAREAEPADVRIAIDAIGTEMQRMNYFLTELHNATHGR